MNKIDMARQSRVQDNMIKRQSKALKEEYKQAKLANRDKSFKKEKFIPAWER